MLRQPVVLSQEQRVEQRDVRVHVHPCVARVVADRLEVRIGRAEPPGGCLLQVVGRVVQMGLQPAPFAGAPLVRVVREATVQLGKVQPVRGLVELVRRTEVAAVGAERERAAHVVQAGGPVRPVVRIVLTDRHRFAGRVPVARQQLAVLTRAALDVRPVVHRLDGGFGEIVLNELTPLDERHRAHRIRLRFLATAGHMEAGGYFPCRWQLRTGRAAPERVDTVVVQCRQQTPILVVVLLRR
uniref:Uncharacterized protein n=1 Tax=Anopheles dirus TaxID=7168 RepID=A0A182NX27_9DIPT